MNILILDDDGFRHTSFRFTYPDDDRAHAFSYEQFLQQLPTKQWDLIHLDHDLGDETGWTNGWGQFQGHTGVEAAARVIELPYKPKVIVHSINPVGARTMIDMLQRAGFEVTHEPFGL